MFSDVRLQIILPSSFTTENASINSVNLNICKDVFEKCSTYLCASECVELYLSVVQLDRPRNAVSPKIGDFEIAFSILDLLYRHADLENDPPFLWFLALLQDIMCTEYTVQLQAIVPECWFIDIDNFSVIWIPSCILICKISAFGKIIRRKNISL